MADLFWFPVIPLFTVIEHGEFLTEKIISFLVQSTFLGVVVGFFVFLINKSIVRESNAWLHFYLPCCIAASPIVGAITNILLY